ncbi:MAG: ABC-2 family transporter protein [Anaerolineales bacterium]|nr:ABC-2 family transporter protein [Anaerolineales bacterium]
MLKHLKVLGALYKAAVLTNLEYRANFIISVILSLISVGWSVAGAAVFYLHTDRIGEWTFDQLLVVLGLFVTFLGVIEGIMYPNVKEIVEHIRMGTMDFILTKPINSQFHASLRRLDIWKLGDILLGIGLLLYAVAQLDSYPTVGQVVLFVVLCLCAVLILYSLIMLLITSAFWFVELENVMELLFTFYDAGRFPVNIFPFWLRATLTFVVPIAFVTTVPASVIIGRVDPALALGSLVVTAVLFTASVLFWQFAVRHYSSASS